MVKRPCERPELPLVLLPGTLCDARMFAPLLAMLDGRASRVLPIDSGASATHVAASLLALVPPRFALLGFSLGGMIALEMARQAPCRIAGLALVSTNARAIDARERPARAAAYRLGDDERAENLVERLWPNYVARTALHDRALFEVIETMAAGHDRNALARQTEIMLSRRSSLALLPSLSMPSLILAGTEDALCPPAMQEEMAAALPHAQFALVDGAGHFLPLEAPDVAASHVAAWLAEVDCRALNGAQQ